MNQDVHVLIEHIQGEVADITSTMLAAARILAQGTGGQVVGLLLGHNAQELARDLPADRIVILDHPALAEFTSDAYVAALADVIEVEAPRAFILGDTTVGAEVAGRLSARLGWPLISYCREVRVEGSTLMYVSQICGGRILAEGPLPKSTVLITMIPGGVPAEMATPRAASPDVIVRPVSDLGPLRVTLKQYVAPEAGDVDLTKEPILVSVGRGIQNEENIELAQELAEALGGVVCSSRPVVDQGWLPTTRLVGKSGKRVRPKLYLALGISGAPEHVEAITGSEIIVAINTDPAAPIFDVAQYGAVMDMFDLLPVLTEHIRKAKEG